MGVGRGLEVGGRSRNREDLKQLYIRSNGLQTKTNALLILRIQR